MNNHVYVPSRSVNAPRQIEGANHREAFIRALELLHAHGRTVQTRNGEARELEHVTIHVEDAWPPHINSPLRKASLPAQIAETAWILRGRNDVEWLSKYLPRAAEFSDDGETWRGGYGPRIRHWSDGGSEFDQLEYVVDLLNEDPETRRAIIAIYNPAIDSVDGKDIPCNNLLRFRIIDGVLHLTVSIRSNDIWWGWSGINSFEWPVLQALVAQLTGTKIGSITYMISNLHIYERHYEKSIAVLNDSKEEIPEILSYNSPNDRWSPENLFKGYQSIEDLDRDLDIFFECESHYPDFIPETVPDPGAGFFEVALEVLWLYRRRGDDGKMSSSTVSIPQISESFDHTYGRELAKALHYSPKIKRRTWKSSIRPRFGERGGTKVTIAWDGQFHVEAFRGSKDVFLEEVSDLHEQKSAGYGDSWRRRGEVLGILANEARKIDRLVLGSDQDHETAEDTAIDLFVYLVKHRIWLVGENAERKGRNVIGVKSYDRIPVPDKLDISASNARDASDDPQLIRSFLFDNLRHQITSTDRDGVSREHIKEREQKTIDFLSTQFDRLHALVESGDPIRYSVLDNMIQMAGNLALFRWTERRNVERKTMNETRRFNGYATTEEED